MKKTLTIGEYLIQQLHHHGARHVFGIPGDYVLGFYDRLFNSKLVRVINTCDEQGAVCITYCVGGLKVANSTAEAFAEKSPVVVISGTGNEGARKKSVAAPQGPRVRHPEKGL